MLWKIGLSFLGSFSLLYYVVLGIKLKRFRSTFATFWLMLGGMCIVLRVMLQIWPNSIHMSMWKLAYPAVALFMWIELLIFSGMKANYRANLPYVIVLGAHVEGTQVTDSLARRLNRARKYLLENKETQVIVSGGQGTGEEITEAEAMEMYLVASGINRARIIKEDKSKTTKENLLFSKEIIKDARIPVGIISNNFHMYRARRCAYRLGYKNVYGLPCSCNPLVFLNYTVREAFAVVKFWLFF